MTDLLTTLPSLQTGSFSNLIPSLERHRITTADLLTLDALDVARRAQLPAKEVRRLTDAVLHALHQELGLASPSVQDAATVADAPVTRSAGPDGLSSTGTDLVADWPVVSLLDDRLDVALGGGVPAGYLTEIVGER